MQRFLKGKVEMNGPGSGNNAAMGLLPAARGEAIKLIQRCTVQSFQRPGTCPTTGRLQKLILIDSLIRPAVFEPGWTISRQEQQRLAGAIRLHSSRQEIGDRRAGAGDHGHGSAGRCCHPQRQKCGRPLIDGGRQP